MGSESVETRKSRSVRENEPTAREGLGGLGPSLNGYTSAASRACDHGVRLAALGARAGPEQPEERVWEWFPLQLLWRAATAGAIALWMVGEASCEASKTTFPPATQDDALQQCIHPTPKGDCCLAPWRENHLLRRLEEWYWPCLA